ncbi:MAG TPA: M56 family metallopeptidase [Vicinamibacterales bacterium]|nr:M56 family metallopeptidase [Vicinamibacterales bacterium]
MAFRLWIVAAYALQLAALVTVACVAAWALRIRIPRHSLRFWQAVMAIALLLPLAQPRGGNPTGLQRFTQSIASASIPHGGGSVAPPGIDAAAILLLILVVGILARLLWLGAGLIRLRTIIAEAQPDEAFANIASELTQSLGVSATVKISDDLEGPATVGVRRPLVLLPRSVVQMSPAVQRAIICHELLHVQRRDWVQTIAEEIWCAILWFHPQARVIAARLSLAREMVVDEKAILITRDRRAYAEALLAFSDPQPHVIGVTPFIGRRSLSHRISLIAEEPAMSRSRRALANAALALGACIAIAAVAIDRVPMFATVHAQSQVYRPGNGVSLPQVVKEVKPEYTHEAMEAHIQGSVWVDCVVNEQGAVSDVKVTKSLDTETGLDQAAIDAVRQWEFRPGMKDGKAVPVQIAIEMTFTLK